MRGIPVNEVPAAYGAASTAGAEAMDGALYEVAGASAIAGAGSHATGLYERSRAHERGSSDGRRPSSKW